MDHPARLDFARAQADGDCRCVTCGQPLTEAVYTPGWLHAETAPHPFAPYHYPDGRPAMLAGCLRCALPAADPVHGRPAS